MRVVVRLFARLREIAGTAELAREVPHGATVETVWSAIVSEFPAMTGYASSISSAVNADYARMDTAVNDGDEVAFLPPVSGGTAAADGGLQLPSRRRKSLIATRTMNCSRR